MRSWALRGFIQQCLSLGGLRFLGALCTLLVNVVLARTLPAEEIGHYFVALGIAVFLAQISTLGSAKLLIKKMAESGAATVSNRVLSAAIILAFLGALGVYGVFIALSSAFGFAVTLPFYAVLGMAWFYIVLAALHGLEASWVSVASQYIAQPVLFLLLVSLSAMTLIESYITSVYLNLAILVVVMRRQGLYAARVSWRDVVGFGKDSRHYLVILVVSVAAGHLLLPFASQWLSDEEVAAAGIVMRLCNVVFFVVVSVRLLLIPKMSRAVSCRPSPSLRYWCAMGALIPGTVFLFVLLLVAQFHTLIFSAFGEYYLPYSSLLIWAIFALIPAAILGWTEAYLMAVSREKVLTLSICLAVCIVFALTPMMLHQWGVLGAVVAIMGVKSLEASIAGAIVVYQSLSNGRKT